MTELNILAGILYIGLAVCLWRLRRRYPQLVAKQMPLWFRLSMLAVMLFHGGLLMRSIFPGEIMYFGVAYALSLILLLALALYWVESFYTPMGVLPLIALPIAAVSIFIAALFPDQHTIGVTPPLFRLHFLVAMLSYSLFTLAALHAVLMWLVGNKLHKGRITALITDLPPLLTMEMLLFRLIITGFVLLTATLASGVLFSEELFGQALRFTHKTFFAILAWLIFLTLLVGRYWRGWRGKLALRWTLAGFGALLLVYAGTQFVLQAILQRS